MSKFLVLKSGKNPGIYLNPKDLITQTQKGKSVVFNHFDTMEEAQEHFDKWQKENLLVTETVTNDTELTPPNHPVDFEEGRVIIYCDGSNLSSGEKYAYGFVIYETKDCVKPFLTGSGVDTKYKDARNIAGECDGVYHAVSTLVEMTDYKKAVIIHDYLGLSHWALGTWKRNKPVSQNFYEKMQHMIKTYNLDLQFHHVRGHTSILGNELADYLAGKALELKKENPEFEKYLDYVYVPKWME